MTETLEEAVSLDRVKVFRDQASRLEIRLDRITDILEMDTEEHSQSVRRIVLSITKTQIQEWIASLRHKMSDLGDCKLCELDKLLGEEALDLAKAVITALNNRSDEDRKKLLEESREKTNTMIRSVSAGISQE